MKKIFTLVWLLIACNIYAQVQPYTPLVATVYGIHQNRTKNDSATHIPHKNRLATNTTDTTTQIFSIGTDLWYFANGQFFKVGGIGNGTGDTANNSISSGLTFSFKARTDQEWDSITGPSFGATDYVPLLVRNNDTVLKNKGVYFIVRNNIPILKGVDYFFYPSTGKISYVQTVNDNETFQIFYSSAPSVADIIDTSSIIVDTSTYGTKFGLIFLGTDITTTQKVQIMPVFGSTYIRTSITMDAWDGASAFLDRIRTAGLHLLLNINWKNVGRDAQGNKVPNRFVQPSEYATYDLKLNQILTKYSDIIDVVVLENEPTTKHFYYGSVLDYIALLAHAIPIVHAHSLIVTDGCIHAGYVQSIINGNLSNVNTRQVDTIIQHYPSLALDYTNIHTAGFGANYNENLVAIANYIRAHNGSKPVMSNEWHVESSYPSLIQGMVMKMKLSHMIYSIIVDPGTAGGGGLPLHNAGTITLNTLGTIYRDAIILP